MSPLMVNFPVIHVGMPRRHTLNPFPSVLEAIEWVNVFHFVFA